MNRVGSGSKVTRVCSFSSASNCSLTELDSPKYTNSPLYKPTYILSIEPLMVPLNMHGALGNAYRPMFLTFCS